MKNPFGSEVRIVDGYPTIADKHVEVIGPDHATYTRRKDDPRHPDASYSVPHPTDKRLKVDHIVKDRVAHTGKVALITGCLALVIMGVTTILMASGVTALLVYLL